MKAGPENGLSKPERDALVVNVMNWCRKLARSHAAELSRAGRRWDVEDLVAEAFLAATEASRFWYPDRGVRFVTFVRPWVQTHLIAVTDCRLDVRADGLEFPERQPDREEGDPDPEKVWQDREPFQLAHAAAAMGVPENEVRAIWSRLAGSLREPETTVVRMCVFDGYTPAQIAIQAEGLPYYARHPRTGVTTRYTVQSVKDVKLIMRNAHARLSRGAKGDEAVERMLAAAGS